ncbi:MAG TPA: YciI family protein [Candidatus Acidoferrales bacterium]|nr:YciI family protein [Candidatus Acidoferrales bacterium]
MKEFMLLIRNHHDHQANWSPEREKQFVEECRVYIDDLTKQGKLISAQPLAREGKMISGSNGTWDIGPYSESKEVIVGYYHVRVMDIDEAIAIAKRNPEFEYGTTARIEVRPIKMKEENIQYTYPAKK